MVRVHSRLPKFDEVGLNKSVGREVKHLSEAVSAFFLPAGRFAAYLPPQAVAGSSPAVPRRAGLRCKEVTFVVVRASAVLRQ